MLNYKRMFAAGTFIGAGLGLFTLTICSMYKGPYTSVDVMLIANFMLLIALVFATLKIK